MAANLKNGLYGPVSGKIGQLVFCKRNGKTYVRSAPKKKKLRKVSKKQLSVRSRFKMTQQLVSYLLPYIRIGFKYTQPDKTAINAAMSYNLREAFKFDDELQNYRLQWNNISFSRGIPNVAEAIKFELVTNELKITWQINSSKRKQLDLYTFKCCVLILPENYDMERLQGCINENSLTSGIQCLQVDIIPESRYHVYIAFFSNDGRGRVMDSEWIGLINA